MEEATVDLDEFEFIGLLSRLAMMTGNGEGEQNTNVEVLQGTCVKAFIFMQSLLASGACCYDS